MEIIAKKLPNHQFAPIDHEEAEKVPIGGLVKIEYIKTRHYENLQRFFTFIKMAFDMQDHFDDKEVFRKWLIMKAGFFTTAVAPNGTVMFFPDSISFDKMEDELEFRSVFTKCLTAYINEFHKQMTDVQAWAILGYD